MQKAMQMIGCSPGATEAKALETVACLSDWLKQWRKSGFVHSLCVGCHASSTALTALDAWFATQPERHLRNTPVVSHISTQVWFPPRSIRDVTFIDPADAEKTLALLAQRETVTIEAPFPRSHARCTAKKLSGDQITVCESVRSLSLPHSIDSQTAIYVLDACTHLTELRLQLQTPARGFYDKELALDKTHFRFGSGGGGGDGSAPAAIRETQITLAPLTQLARQARGLGDRRRTAASARSFAASEMRKGAVTAHFKIVTAEAEGLSSTQTTANSGNSQRACQAYVVSALPEADSDDTKETPSLEADQEDEEDGDVVSVELGRANGVVLAARLHHAAATLRHLTLRTWGNGAPVAWTRGLFAELPDCSRLRSISLHGLNGWRVLARVLECAPRVHDVDLSGSLMMRPDETAATRTQWAAEAAQAWFDHATASWLHVKDVSALGLEAGAAFFDALLLTRRTAAHELLRLQHFAFGMAITLTHATTSLRVRTMQMCALSKLLCAATSFAAACANVLSFTTPDVHLVAVDRDTLDKAQTMTQGAHEKIIAAFEADGLVLRQYVDANACQRRSWIAIAVSVAAQRADATKGKILGSAIDGLLPAILDLCDDAAPSRRKMRALSRPRIHLAAAKRRWAVRGAPLAAFHRTLFASALVLQPAPCSFHSPADLTFYALESDDDESNEDDDPAQRAKQRGLKRKCDRATVS